MTIMQIPISIILKRILFVICCFFVVMAGVTGVYTRFLPIPDGLVAQFNMEWYWFIKFWYIWVLGAVSYITIIFLYTQGIWSRIRTITIKPGEDVGVRIDKSGKWIKIKNKEHGPR